MASQAAAPGSPVRQARTSSAPSASPLTPARPRRAPRQPSNIAVVEPPPLKADAPAAPPAADDEAPGKRACPEEEPEDREAAAEAEATKKRRTFSRLAKDTDDGTSLEPLPPVGFAEDYFVSPSLARPLRPGVARAVAAAAAEEAEPALCSTAHGGQGWLRLLQDGFSLLVQGAGSKKRLLEAFADETLLPSGAAVVRIDGFDLRLSLVEVLRDVLEKIYPWASTGAAPAASDAGGATTDRRCLSSVEGLAATICRAHAASASAAPLWFVVHNLEQMSQAHQGALATLAAAPGVHVVASVDSIWANLGWHSRHLKDFNFCREEVHTFRSYEAEGLARYPDGLPVWADPTATRKSAPKASLGLVLRSLTRSHRELVEVIAKHQLENGGRTGISASKLLGIASDHMIASSASKLRTLMNELTDHEVVGQRTASDGGTLFHLQCSASVLERLAEGQAPEDSEAEEDTDVD